MNESISRKVIKLIAVCSALVLIAVFFVIQSCSKEDSSSKSTPITYDYNLNVPEAFKKIGALHNEGMDSIFEAVKITVTGNIKKSGLTTKSSFDYSSIIQKATIKFCQTNLQLKNSFNDKVANTISRQYISGSFLKSANNVDSIVELSDKQKTLIYKIREAIKDAQKEGQLSFLKEKLVEINQLAANTLNEKEIVPIYFATSTAYASFQYWQNNNKKWYVITHYAEVVEQYYKAHPEMTAKINPVSKLKSSGYEYYIDADGNVVYGLGDVYIYPTDNFFNKLAGFVDNVSNAIGSWWDTNATDVIAADGEGGAAAIAWGLSTGFNDGTLVFGPEGIVLSTASEAVGGAITGSALSIIHSF
jgi:hypothetical protein